MPIVSNDKGNLVFTPQSEDAWKKSFSRILLNGPPLSGKTTSFLTFPPKRRIIVVPGELGFSSIMEDDNTELYYWEVDAELRQEEAERYKTRLREVIKHVLAKDDNTFIGLDGLHKLYQLILTSHGWPTNEDKFGEKAYGKGHGLARAEFVSIVQTILTSKTPYVAMTVYDGPELEEAGGKKTVIYPDLPGQMAKGVMGMFPCVFHTRKVSDGTVEKYKWELSALGNIQGAGMHVPATIKAKFPQSIEAGWPNVEKYLDIAAAK